jgi:hypothetical protein
MNHMKKAFTLCMLLIGLGATAQQRPHHQHGKQRMYQEFSSEQEASLKSKKMTLALNLDEAQQEQVESLLSRHFATRREMQEARNKSGNTEKTQDPEARYAHISKRLDHQIAFQRDLRKILSDAQFEQWQEQRGRRKPRAGHRRGRR